MEEATLDLRNTIYLALSIDNESSLNLAANDVHAAAATATAAAATTTTAATAAVSGGGNGNGNSSECSTYTSSLSGSLPSDSIAALTSRRKKSYFAAHLENESTGIGNGGGIGSGIDDRKEWQMKRLQMATLVENAVSNYELAVYHHYQHQQQHSDNNYDEIDEHHGEDIVDLLVALLTSVPRQLMLHHQQSNNSRQQYLHYDPYEEEDYTSSMEQLCFNSACIASTILQKYFLRVITFNNTMEDNHHPVIEEEHIHDLLEEVVQFCNNVNSSSNSNKNNNMLDPILGVLNSLLEERQIDRLIYEREQQDGNNADEVDGDAYQSLLSCLSSKETLRLIHVLAYRYLCDIDDEDNGDDCNATEASTQYGYFIGYLLEYFTHIVREEVECTTDTSGLFDAWADGLDEFMTPRLTDDEAQDVHTLIVRYHIAIIQSSLQLMENAELVTSRIIAESQKNNGIIVEGAVENIVVELQDTLRHLIMITHTTEAMEKLNLEPDPGIHVIFHPLVSSYARFTVTCWHDAILFLQRAWERGSSNREIENLSIQVDDILIRLCRSTFGKGTILPCLPNAGDEDDIISVSLLCAMNTRRVTGKARYLLDIASDRAQFTNIVDDIGEPFSKRRRYGHGYDPLLRNNALSLPPTNAHDGMRSPSSDERRGEMTNLILACLALSQSSQDDELCDSSSMIQANCITSALMFTKAKMIDNDMKAVILDPLNPWHTIQVKTLQKMARLQHDECSINDSLTNYLAAVDGDC
ncbi:hypothetical protein ACHAWU_009021 [Discostella pseudostelligera]|uniref:Nuclear pore complex protein n=1 Tax=Discostella pseudostelligera TaxID=259834 RepID=A0ABD3MIQ5_9STRA